MSNALREKQLGNIHTGLALLVILLPTALVWQGVRLSGFTPDDYMVIDIQSPVSTFIDAISMFWRHDPNPQYWRPLTNSSVSVDFWLWGWNGSMFHITNLLLHLVATTLVYFFLLRIFAVRQYVAIGVALLFGIAACHDTNLLWIAARSDVIATICMLATLLAAYKALISGERLWKYLSYLFFLLGLCSKEVSAVSIALLPLIIWADTPQQLWRRRKQILNNLVPYFLVGVAFLFIRLQFTVPLAQMQPVVAEGSRSPVAFAKNVLYSIGYILAPIDFATASDIINRYLVVGAVAAILVIVVVGVMFWKFGHKEALRLIYKPVALTIITALVSFQSFERWRVYFPSVGVFAALAIVAITFWNSSSARSLLRILSVLVIAGLVGFNVVQTLGKQRTWARATEMISGYKEDLKTILASHTERPIRLNLITNPVKFGDAQLIQLSAVFLPRAAEAEWQNEPLLSVGSLGDAKEDVDLTSNLDIYALDPERGFERLLIEKKGSTLIISERADTKGHSGGLAFAPNIPITDGVAKRDRVYREGSSYNTEGAVVTVRRAEGAFIKEAEITVIDTAGVPIYFDGSHIREF